MTLARFIVGAAGSDGARAADIGAISQLLGAVSHDGASSDNHDTDLADGLSPAALKRMHNDDST
jgi:hypothetical protein